MGSPPPIPKLTPPEPRDDGSTAYPPPVRPNEPERRPQERLEALGPAPRPELLHVLMLPDFDSADRIGELWDYPESRALAEAPDRLRGGPGPSGGAGREVAGTPRVPPGPPCPRVEDWR